MRLKHSMCHGLLITTYIIMYIYIYIFMYVYVYLHIVFRVDFKYHHELRSVTDFWCQGYNVCIEM